MGIKNHTTPCYYTTYVSSKNIDSPALTFFQFVAISGKTSKRFGTVNCAKMRLAAGLCRDPLGSYSTPPDPLAVIRGRGGKEGEGNSWE